jgi:hydrogenase nickel incorporation protein HypA/HybF
MHELSLAMNLVDAVEEEAARHTGTVEAIHLRLGQLSGVVKEALSSGFEMAREGTALAATRLIIEEVPIAVWCPVCQAEQPAVSQQWLCCARCGTPAPDVVHGKELEIFGLEMTDGLEITDDLEITDG